MTEYQVVSCHNSRIQETLNEWSCKSGKEFIGWSDKIIPLETIRYEVYKFTTYKFIQAVPDGDYRTNLIFEKVIK